MNFEETVFERDGKIIFHFDEGNGCSQECDNPKIAESMRRSYRAKEERERAAAEARAAAAADTSVKKQMEVMTKDDPETARHMRTLDEIEKAEYERSDLKPCIAPVKVGSALPAEVEKAESAGPATEEPSSRINLSKKIKSTSWRDLLETEYYGNGLHFTQDGGEMTMLSTLYYSQGGRNLKAAYKDPTKRKAVIDEIMAAQVSFYAGTSQLAGMMISSLKDQAISGNFNNPNSAFKSALDVKMRADKMVLQVIESHHRVQNAVAGSVYVNKAEQVNLQYNNSDPKEAKREEISGPPRLRSPKRLKAKK